MLRDALSLRPLCFFLPALRNSPDSPLHSFLLLPSFPPTPNAAFACLKFPGHVSPLPPAVPPSVRPCFCSAPNVSSLSLSRCRGFGRITEAPRHAHRSTMIVRKGGSTTLAVAAAVILIAGVSQSSQPDTLDLKAFVLPFQRCENNCI